ncbi:MAG: protoheme farnesyltransferase, partial [Actinomycetota bacterium]
TVVASLALIWVADLGPVYAVTAAVLGALFLGGTIALGRSPSAAGSMRLFSFSITYLSVLFVALTVDVLVR